MDIKKFVELGRQYGLECNNAYPRYLYLPNQQDDTVAVFINERSIKFWYSIVKTGNEIHMENYVEIIAAKDFEEQLKSFKRELERKMK